MDAVDKAILAILQDDFPLTAMPYAEIGRRLDISEAEVLSRVAALKANGVIRRIGAVFSPQRLGFVSTLCAARVPEDRETAFVAAVNAIAGVTHHYRRGDAYNCWFTLICPSAAILEETLAALRRDTGVDDILSLRAVKTYKINARFDP